MLMLLYHGFVALIIFNIIIIAGLFWKEKLKFIKHTKQTLKCQINKSGEKLIGLTEKCQ